MNSTKQESQVFSSLLAGGFGVAVLLVIFLVISTVAKWTRPPGPYAPVSERSEAKTKAKAPEARGGAASGGYSVTVAKGEQLYNAFCIACHQAEGAGKVGFAPFIRNPHFLSLTSDEFLRQTIVQGRPGTAMTPWAHMKPDEIDSVIAYLRSGENPNIKPVAKIDAGRKHPGDAAAGAAVYGQYCASCHGANATGYAEGGPGPAIGNHGFLSVASDDYIFQTVKHGRAGTAMRPFSGSKGLANLSDDEIGNVIAYLREHDHAATVVASTGPDPKTGKMHFDANCAACHQPNGAGRPGMAPSIGNRDFLALASDDFIRNTVRKGRFGTSMVQRPDLSDAVLDDIIAYLRSLPVKNVVKVDIDHSKNLADLGDKKRGHEKFGLYCAACHGPKGEGYAIGGAGPAIGLSGFLGSASDEFIMHTLKVGRINTAMRPFIGARGLANLNEQDAFDIISYMRSLDTTNE